jgi:predicted metal-binding membrane protein
MSSPAHLRQPRPGQATLEVALVLMAAGGAWAGTIVLARGMTGMTGTMGLGLAVFVPVWTLMMAAMMLPSVTPLASLYARTVQSNRTVRLAGLVAGYLAVWAAASRTAGPRSRCCCTTAPTGDGPGTCGSGRITAPTAWAAAGR